MPTPCPFTASVEDPAIFVFDYVPNAWDYLIREKGDQFFLEDPHFAHYEWDSKMKEEVDKKNAAQRELFEKLKKQGEKKIYYLKSDGMVGEDAEGFVENIHFTDLGMMRYADWISPYLRKYLKK